jgi:hypothetical protein
MNQALVDRIVNAVLYEGYMLYPYRPSVKNRQRWTFGGLYPRAYSEAQGGDPWAMQTECLIQGDGHSTLRVTVRFLHLQARTVGDLDRSSARPRAGEEPAFRPVESLRVGDSLLHAWQEATEREVALGAASLETLLSGPHREGFAFPGGRQCQRVADPQGRIIGAVVREQQAVAGLVEVSAVAAGPELFKVRVGIENHTPMPDAGSMSRDEAQLRSLISTHTILNIGGGKFVSLLDPPAEWRAAAAGCRNVGTWPVLVGEAGETDAMLSSPIILYDYPQIAPESPGDLFDSTEIDEILTLRILTLTDEEKRAAAATDGRVAALLRRSETLAREQLLGLHGTVRGLQHVSAEGRHD